MTSSNGSTFTERSDDSIVSRFPSGRLALHLNLAVSGVSTKVECPLNGKTGKVIYSVSIALFACVSLRAPNASVGRSFKFHPEQFHRCEGFH